MGGTYEEALMGGTYGRHLWGGPYGEALAWGGLCSGIILCGEVSSDPLHHRVLLPSPDTSDVAGVVSLDATSVHLPTYSEHYCSPALPY